MGSKTFGFKSPYEKFKEDRRSGGTSSSSGSGTTKSGSGAGRYGTFGPTPTTTTETKQISSLSEQEKKDVAAEIFSKKVEESRAKGKTGPGTDEYYKIYRQLVGYGNEGGQITYSSTTTPGYVDQTVKTYTGGKAGQTVVTSSLSSSEHGLEGYTDPGIARTKFGNEFVNVPVTSSDSVSLSLTRQGIYTEPEKLLTTEHDYPKGENIIEQFAHDVSSTAGKFYSENIETLGPLAATPAATIGSSFASSFIGLGVVGYQVVKGIRETPGNIASGKVTLEEAALAPALFSANLLVGTAKWGLSVPTNLLGSDLEKRYSTLGEIGAFYVMGKVPFVKGISKTYKIAKSPLLKVSDFTSSFIGKSNIGIKTLSFTGKIKTSLGNVKTSLIDFSGWPQAKYETNLQLQESFGFEQEVNRMQFLEVRKGYQYVEGVGTATRISPFLNRKSTINIYSKGKFKSTDLFDTLNQKGIRETSGQFDVNIFGKGGRNTLNEYLSKSAIPYKISPDLYVNIGNIRAFAKNPGELLIGKQYSQIYKIISKNKVPRTKIAAYGYSEFVSAYTGKFIPAEKIAIRYTAEGVSVITTKSLGDFTKSQISGRSLTRASNSKYYKYGEFSGDSIIKNIKLTEPFNLAEINIKFTPSKPVIPAKSFDFSAWKPTVSDVRYSSSLTGPTSASKILGRNIPSGDIIKTQTNVPEGFSLTRGTTPKLGDAKLIQTTLEQAVLSDAIKQSAFKSPVISPTIVRTYNIGSPFAKISSSISNKFTAPTFKQIRNPIAYNFSQIQIKRSALKGETILKSSAISKGMVSSLGSGVLQSNLSSQISKTGISSMQKQVSIQSNIQKSMQKQLLRQTSLQKSMQRTSIFNITQFHPTYGIGGMIKANPFGSPFKFKFPSMGKSFGKTFYTPSLGGLEFLDPIKSAPTGRLTGIEWRAPTFKQIRNQFVF